MTRVAARDIPSSVRSFVRSRFVGCSALIVGCFAGLTVGCTAPPVEPDLTSDRADAKVPALVAQADRGDDADYPALVRALDDDDPAVRFAAARSLRSLTGEDYGYRFFDSRLDRQDAVARWQDWLIERQTPPPAVTLDSDSPTATVRSAQGPDSSP
ncbi:MAG: hypothetical protein AAGH92_03730 [Planctomycetota bacterium]